MIRKKRVFRIVLTVTLVTLFCVTVSHASTRARFVGESIFQDASVRIAGGQEFTCKVNDDGTVSCWGVVPGGVLGVQPIVLISGVTNAVAITAGISHVCALLADGTARCWGDGLKGQLGNGANISSDTPVNVTGLTRAVAITAGQQHTCAVLSDGTVRCWGLNRTGQLGDNSTTSQPSPVTVAGLNNAVAVAAGLRHTCALLADGTVKCWGGGTLGELGDDVVLSRFFASRIVVNVSNAVAISAEGASTCALLADGTVRCWGFNNHGQLGDNSTTTRFHAVPVSGLSSAVAISAGGYHTCALLADGTSRCWGVNSFGQLGDNSSGTDRRTPVFVGASNPLRNAVAITAGAPDCSRDDMGQCGEDQHTCALMADGAVKCWGRDNLGTGITGNVLTPALVAGTGGTFAARDVAAGRNHTCVVRGNGTVSCWGSNDSGQLGLGTFGGMALSPTGVPGLTNVVAITAGEAHTCALLADGIAKCWGRNTSSELGDGTNLNSPSPVIVTGLTNAIAIAAGGGLGASHTCALLADGTAKCWGANSTGQIGNNSTSPQPIPVSVSGLFQATAIAVGEFHTCALLADGSARCWGANGSGQLGDATNTPRLTPLFPVSGLGNAVALAAGNTHTCALLAAGGARCWGGNLLGQLGDNTTTSKNVSGPVLGLSTAVTVAITGGFGQTCALIFNGKAQCWGDNSAGQLGNDTTNSTVAPGDFVKVKIANLFTLITPLTKAVNITTGRRHSCALLSNGGVSCWGDNTFGQLGIGSSTVTQLTTASGVPSLTLNIDPTVTFNHQGRVSTVTVIATCEVGQRLFFDVNLTQGTAAGRGHGSGECTGALERYTVTVPSHGRDSFLEGPAQVSAKAVIVDKGTVVDIQEWTRAVTVGNVP
jgi:alpha-tubulin suppressor-like RCC1 family protein